MVSREQYKGTMTIVRHARRVALQTPVLADLVAKILCDLPSELFVVATEVLQPISGRARPGSVEYLNMEDSRPRSVAIGAYIRGSEWRKEVRKTHPAFYPGTRYAAWIHG